MVNLERKEKNAQSNDSNLNYVRKDLEISQHETLSHKIADVFHSVQIFGGVQKNNIKSKKGKRLLEVFTYSKRKKNVRVRGTVNFEKKILHRARSSPMNNGKLRCLRIKKLRRRCRGIYSLRNKNEKSPKFPSKNGREKEGGMWKKSASTRAYQRAPR